MMTPANIQTLIDAAFALALLLLPSIFVALLPHPSEEQKGIYRTLLLALGRISMLRHGASPGTLHVPLTAQPAPSVAPAETRAAPAEPAFKRECPECFGVPAEGGWRVLHAACCGSVGYTYTYNGNHFFSGPEAAERWERARRAAADTIPELPSMRTAPRIAPLALLIAAGLALAVLPACTMLTPPRKATASAMKSAGARAGKLKAWAATEEQAILDSSKTQEEARSRLGAHRRAVDYCSEEVVRPAALDLREVSKALGAEPGAPAAAAPATPGGAS